MNAELRPVHREDTNPTNQEPPMAPMPWRGIAATEFLLRKRPRITRIARMKACIGPLHSCDSCDSWSPAGVNLRGTKKQNVCSTDQVDLFLRYPWNRCDPWLVGRFGVPFGLSGAPRAGKSTSRRGNIRIHEEFRLLFRARCALPRPRSPKNETGNTGFYEVFDIFRRDPPLFSAARRDRLKTCPTTARIGLKSTLRLNPSSRGELMMRRILEVWLVAMICCAALARGDDDPRRPPAIETQEVPRVPPEVFARLGQYQNTRSAAFAGFSPDGKGILIATRFGNSAQLHRVYEPAGRREQVTFFEEPAGGRIIPQAKDGAVLLSISRGGDENDQLYLLDRAAYRTTLLTDGKSKHNLGPILRDGSKMIVASNRRNGRDTDLYVADCRKPDSLQPLLETNGEFWTAQDWSQDGKKLLLIRYVSINETYPAILDVATRTKEPLPIPRHASDKTAVADLAFSPDGRTVYFTSDAQGEFLQLGRLALASGELAWLSSNIPWDVRGVVVEPTSGRVAFLTNEDGASRLYLLEGDKPRSLECAGRRDLEPRFFARWRESWIHARAGRSARRCLLAEAGRWSAHALDVTAKPAAWTLQRLSPRRASAIPRSTAARFRPITSSRGMLRQPGPPAW